MRNRLFSLVLALSMILMAVPGLGSITVAAAEDTAIIEYDATKLREIYTSGSYASSATMLAPYGITVNTTNVYGSSDNAIVDKTSNNTTVSSVMGVRTAGMPAVKFDFKKWGTATAEEGGGFDLTKTSDINPNVTTMDGSSTYMVETRFITYIYDGTAKTSYLRYELRGVDASGNLLTIARLRFDRATNTIYLVDTEDNVIGSAAAAAFGLSLPIPGYVRFVADLEQQTYSAYLALYEIDSSSKFVDEATMKAVPEELIVLAQNQPFLSNGIKQLTRLDVSGRFDGSGNVAASFYNVKASQMADASVDNATANYDLQVGGDLTATLTPVTHRLQKITLDGTDLTLTDDYTVSENTFTILEDTLKTLAVGEHTLTFVMDGGANPTVTITVSDTPLVSTGDTTIIEYDAADLLEIYNAALEGDSTVTAYNAIKDYGISLSNCWSGGNNALGADANVTGGVTVLRFGFSNSATTTEAERGGIDLTKESTLNPAVPVMDGDNTYMLEAQFVTYIYDSSNKSSIIRYELRGTNSSESHRP